MKNWYEIDGIDKLDSPALVVFPERVKKNIASAIEMVGDVDRLRPHVKTNKSIEVTKMMIDAGISKFKCATIAEAEMLGMCKAKDVLLAYQPNGPKIERFAALVKKYPGRKYSCLVDNISVSEEQSNIFQKNGITVPVFIDLNVGMNRTGISPGDGAIELYKRCLKLEGINPVGLHAYDGHIRQPEMTARTAQCHLAFSAIERLKNELIKISGNNSIDEPIIIAGGTPTFSIHCKRENVECSPGTFVYWDIGYSVLCEEQPFIHAAVLVTRIISLPEPTRLCTDLGHKSVAAENDISKRVFFLNAPELEAKGQSEEHLVLEAEEGHPYKVGDVLYGIPYHICPTVALYERVFTVKDHALSAEWKNIARDRMITI